MKQKDTKKEDNLNSKKKLSDRRTQSSSLVTKEKPKRKKKKEYINEFRILKGNSYCNRSRVFKLYSKILVSNPVL